MLVEIVVSVVVVVVTLTLWIRNNLSHCVTRKIMKGKTVIITGATAGIGLYTARDLLRRGARVIIACRNLEKANKVAGKMKEVAGEGGEVVVQWLDTSDLASVRNFASDVLDKEKNIHVLVNNAGIVGQPEKQMTKDGLEMTMATNYFGHFLLTNLLLERLKQSAPSRIVNVSSISYKYIKNLDMDSLNLEKDTYTLWKAYSQSKLCNVLFTVELARKLGGSGVTANSLHPGFVSTDIGKSQPNSLKSFFLKCCMYLGKNAEKGAQTSIHLAVSEKVEGVSGRYFEDCKEVKPTELGRDQAMATKLWEASEKAVKLDPLERHY